MNLDMQWFPPLLIQFHLLKEKWQPDVPTKNADGSFTRTWKYIDAENEANRLRLRRLNEPDFLQNMLTISLRCVGKK